MHVIAPGIGQRLPLAPISPGDRRGTGRAGLFRAGFFLSVGLGGVLGLAFDRDAQRLEKVQVGLREGAASSDLVGAGVQFAAFFRGNLV
jgi:hypothetical protein